MRRMRRTFSLPASTGPPATKLNLAGPTTSTSWPGRRSSSTAPRCCSTIQLARRSGSGLRLRGGLIVDLPAPAAAILSIGMCSAAYAAEILRGSLATVLRDQSEAASVLGATWWQTQSRVVVPQVWRGNAPCHRQDRGT
mgnify:CR=1 FL=1